MIEKLNSACKKLAIPYIRVESVNIQESICDVQTNIGMISVGYDESKDDEKSIVHKFLTQAPEVKPYSYIDVVKVDGCKTKALDIGKLPNSFRVTGLPYKQIKITTGEAPVFVDLCKSSYTKVYNYFYSLYSKDKEVDFEKLSSLIKRKELLVLLLSISK